MLVNVLLVIAAVGTVAAHVGAGWRRSTRDVAGLVVLDLVLALLGWAAQNEDLWAGWMREDAWVEWSTAYAFLAGTVVFGWRAWRGQGWSRFTGIGLALFCFFVAGEELSWGQRVLSFEPPEIFLEKNFQQEANLHNLLTNEDVAGYSLDSRFLVAIIAVVYGVLGSLLSLLPARWTWARDLAPPLMLAPAYALIAAVELEYPLHLAGEAAEWVLGLTFLLDGLLRRDRPAPPGHWATLLVPASVALGATTAPVLDALVFGSDDERVAQAQAELDLLSADLAAAMQTPLERKSRVHKRIYTAIEAEYLAFGTGSQFLEGQPNPAEVDEGARSDRKGYFLDPWSNAYWILWDDSGDTLILYSFGPNRRRDIDTRPYKNAAGDDIVTVLRAP